MANKKDDGTPFVLASPDDTDVQELCATCSRFHSYKCHECIGWQPAVWYTDICKKIRSEIGRLRDDLAFFDRILTNDPNPTAIKTVIATCRKRLKDGSK